jgi:hypothetical protein
LRDNITTGQTKTSRNPPNYLARCLALLDRQQPELALVLRAWDELPEAIRAGIVATVKTAIATNADEKG